ncbi:PspC domain-containing protein [Streptosporangium sp. NPDC051022]|uniref:PspC domain-containing protein n=1 Tax=Streptosporangium sp. NPDC051022 TaxID=3155752 RepID=UPI00341D07E2
MNENDFSGVRQLRRTKDGRIIAGVASGLGRYIGIDPNIIRAALAIATFFGGLGVGIYAIGWLLLPEEGKNSSIVQDLVSKNKDNPVWLDARAKAEQGWAKAEQSWSRTTHQRGPQNTAPTYPTHQEPAPYQAPAPQYPEAQRHDGPTPQA